MNDKNGHKVAIVGGGIAGLSTAIALKQKGSVARVYESAPALRDIGAGIWMPSNAMQIFDRLGFAEKIEAAGAQLTGIELSDYKHGALSRTDLTQVASRFGFSTTTISRGDLLNILAEQLAPDQLTFGQKCQSLQQDEGSQELRFEDGSTASADLIIAADGIRSTLRQQYMPQSKTWYSGQSSYRAIVQADLPSHLTNIGVEIWGRGCRFGFSNLSSTEVYWYATFQAAAGETWDREFAKQQLLERFQKFPSPVLTLIEAASPGILIRADIHDLTPIPQWHHGNMVLVGDAAHAATPNLGQGGAQAIEDAWVLADALAEHSDPQIAFAQFEKIRRPKIATIVSRSRFFGKLAHIQSRPLRALRDILLKTTPASLSQRQFESLYTLNY